MGVSLAMCGVFMVLSALAVVQVVDQRPVDRTVVGRRSILAFAGLCTFAVSKRTVSSALDVVETRRNCSGSC
jgi:hypothetical protein